VWKLVVFTSEVSTFNRCSFDSFVKSAETPASEEILEGGREPLDQVSKFGMPSFSDGSRELVDPRGSSKSNICMISCFKDGSSDPAAMAANCILPSTGSSKLVTVAALL